MPEDIPRGFRDFSPAETISRKYITGVIEEVFKRFGFYPLETPALENLETLNAKAYGEESTKELYKLEGEDTGLRYDFTVPLARYVASNKALTLPFKRYQIGNCWRKEEPQKMRYREFMQADIDIIGNKEVESDAEIVVAIASTLDQLGIRNYLILINSRQLLQKILSYFKIPADKQTQFIRVLDKLQKIGRDDIMTQLSQLGLASKDADALLNFVQQKAENEEKLNKLEANMADAKEEVEKTRKLLNMVSEYKIEGSVEVDLSLARGLSYYTGFVFEFVLMEDGKRLPTIAGGGRYDNLVGLYSKKEIPAVGASIGIDRISNILGVEEGIKTYAKAYIAYIGEQNRSYAIAAAKELRNKGIYVDLNSTTRNLSKQLEYAGSLKIANVLIMGDKEREANKVKLRNMLIGTEELISLQEAIQKLGS